MSIPLSVLDLAPVGEGTTAGEALARSTDLIQYVEALGYTRHWVAEHHNMPGIASSSPPVLIAHLAARSSTIRVGSGGVMLPNHAPLIVAEQFGTLEALHPGRIDLGLGRAPGTDPQTTAAIRGARLHESVDEFPRHVAELRAYLAGPTGRVSAYPRAVGSPEVWLLGSSDFSAQLAGLLGLPFSFAHHFSAASTLPALAAYRQLFSPSEELDRPHAMVAVSVICAPDDEEAAWLAGSSRLSFARLRSGRPGLLPTPEEAAAHEFTPMEREIIRTWSSSMIVGSPETVRDGLVDLLDFTGADEVMVTTMVHGHAERLRSYDLLAALWPDVLTTAALTTGDDHGSAEMPERGPEPWRPVARTAVDGLPAADRSA
jgi:luciferase family oxidoreductase group 1